jgi:hypothetical protein
LICELLLAHIINTSELQKDCDPPKVEIVVVESESNKRERLERESIVKRPVVRSKTFSSGSAISLYPDSTNNCVKFAKQQTGITRIMGLGGMSAIQGHEPKVGAIGVTPGHATVVVAINDNLITIHESNYKKGFITERVLTKDNFLGYIYN